MTFRTFALAATLTAFAGMPALAADFSLVSPDLKDGGSLAEAQVSNTFGCDGGNVSPALSWQNAPAGTRSFVVTAYDPDAPTGSGFWHWVMFNIPADVEGIDAGITPDSGAPKGAVQSRADAGFASYLGACPPAGQTASLCLQRHGAFGRKARTRRDRERRADRLHDQCECAGPRLHHGHLRSLSGIRPALVQATALASPS